MLKTSARESWRSRSARVEASLTSWDDLVVEGRGKREEHTSSRFIVAERAVLGT